MTPEVYLNSDSVRDNSKPQVKIKRNGPQMTLILRTKNPSAETLNAVSQLLCSAINKNEKVNPQAVNTAGSLLPGGFDGGAK